ncbi:GtrA family protein [Phenylobacterium sp. LjRoot164]|uniref:GtrA family protein n=1 Tax=unclassified Phenylobacterium TaxID=2640670 RepID=UPI003ECCCF37
MITAARLRQVGVFALVGVAATATHAIVAMAAHRVGHASPLIANMAGYLSAVMISYLGHSTFTFGTDAFSGPQFLRFVVASLAVLILNQAVMFACANLLAIPFDYALAITIVSAPVISFIISKLWVFVE